MSRSTSRFVFPSELRDDLTSSLQKKVSYLLSFRYEKNYTIVFYIDDGSVKVKKESDIKNTNIIGTGLATQFHSKKNGNPYFSIERSTMRYNRKYILEDRFLTPAFEFDITDKEIDRVMKMI